MRVNSIEFAGRMSIAQKEERDARRLAKNEGKDGKTAAKKEAEARKLEARRKVEEHRESIEIKSQWGHDV